MPHGEIRPLDFSLTPVMDGTRPFAVIAEARELLAPGEPASA
jgi:hypothetical protein